MSSSLPSEQPPPPLMVIAHQADTSRSGNGSIGPVIAVLAVIAVLGVVAGMIGRLCAGKTVFGRGHYDLEGWIERNCASCIDGRVDPPQPPPPHSSIPVAAAPQVANRQLAGEHSAATSTAEAADP